MTSALYDLESENIVIGYTLLLGIESYEAALSAGLESSHLHDPRNKIIFRTFGKLAKNGIPIDGLSLKKALEEAGQLDDVGLRYLAQITDGIPLKLDVVYYAKQLVKLWGVRDIVEKAAKVQAAALQGNGDLSVAIEKFRSAFLETKPKNPFIAQPYWNSFDAANIHTWPCPKLEPIIEGILAKGNLLWLAAETQTGKTLFMLWVCLQLLNKGSLFDKFAITPVKRILYVALEDPARRFKARLLDMAPAKIEAGRFVIYIAPGLSIADPLSLLFLEKMIQEGGFDLVVIDTFQAATMGVSSFDDEKLSVIIRHLLDITRKLGITIVVNDHFRKTQNNKKRPDLDLNDVKGSGGKLQNADVFLLMDRKDGKLRISGRSKEWERPIGFLLDIAPQGSQGEKFTYAGDLGDMAASRKEVGEANRIKVLEAMPADDWITRAQIAAAAGMTDRTVKNHIASLIESGLVRTNGREGKAIRYQSGNGIGKGEVLLFPNTTNNKDTES
jgi:replicative DNA helicase/DNA-binding transcriptional ArsR family regulator